MSIDFLNLSIDFDNQIANGQIKTLDDISNYVIEHSESLTKPSEPRRLFRNGCNKLQIDLNTAKNYIKSKADLLLVLEIDNIIDDDIDKFLRTF